MRYWVTVNPQYKVGVVHRYDCPYLLRPHQNPTGLEWHGPYDLAVNAMDAALDLEARQIRNCAVCWWLPGMKPSVDRLEA